MRRSDSAAMNADDQSAAIERAVEVLRGGGLVALPTETVYGLGADARNPDAVRRIFSVKGRPADHPLIVHLGSAADLDAFAVDIPDDARKLAARFWPGPLTIVLWRAPDVPDVVTGGRDTVALRVPDHAATLAVLRALGSGVAAPSANRFGHVSPTTADHVRQDLGEEVDYVLDGGPCKVGLESTIVDLTTEIPVLLRPGAVTAEQIEATLGRPIERTATGPARAPGMLRAHYAPHTKVELVAPPGLAPRARALMALGARVGMLTSSSTESIAGVRRFDLGTSAEDAGRALYASLRAADAAGLDVILVVEPPADDELAPAIADRLSRAAAAHRPESP